MVTVPVAGSWRAVEVPTSRDCIDAAVFGDGEVEAFADSSGTTLTEEESTCAVKAISEEFGGAGNLMLPP